ncbi:SPFH domain-containing protein [Streptomyces sp. NPDC058195]|uniref:SPFH domain-containing protein n=1 Tax=Streptomyces sp. NPDC058195 TaxID=3346375 RepID=UPI0036EBE1FB
MRSTVSDSSGTPEDGRPGGGRLGDWAAPVPESSPVWPPDRTPSPDRAVPPGWETADREVPGWGGGEGGREVPRWEVPERGAGEGREVLGWEVPERGAGEGGREVPRWEVPDQGAGEGGREALGWGAGEGGKEAPRRETPEDRGVPRWEAPEADGFVPGAAADSVVDLVLDLVPGDDPGTVLGTTSASVSVPAVPVPTLPAAAGEPLAPATADRTDREVGSPPAPRHRPARETVFDSLPVSGGDAAGPSGDALRAAGRHQAVIATERPATIPVHLLFREDAARAEAARAEGARAEGAGPPHDDPWWGGDEHPRPGAVRRPPLPRGPQVRPPTRPAPAGDPFLAERPGPALPGWLALFTALAGATGAGAVLWWSGALPAGVLHRLGFAPRPDGGIGFGVWAALAALASLALFALGGLSRGRVGHAWVLTLFGEYRGSVRRTGLMWISPLLLRRRIDVRLRHWRSEPLPAVDANGTALRVVVLVVWRIDDTARAALGVADHETYLREQVEAAMARVLSQLPADAFHEDTRTLRNAEAVGNALTRLLRADCEPVGIEVYSAQPTGIEYAPEVAAAMQRRRIAALDAKHRDSVLTSVVDAVDDTVNRLTARGIVELDDYERKSLVKDLTVAFYTGRNGRDGS